MRRAEVAGAAAPHERKLQRIDRQQLRMRVIDPEELIEKDHPARAIWALVAGLDVSRYEAEIKSEKGAAGRAAIDPRLLISIWIYSYSEGESSAREISRLCRYDPAYQWLTGMQEINYHTLADFRVREEEGLKEIFVEVLAVLSAEGLVEMRRMTQDGTKVKAFAAARTFRREGRIDEHLELAREQIKALGEEQVKEESGQRRKARARVVREKIKRLEQAKKAFAQVRASKRSKEKREEARVSISEPEARVMKQAGGGFAPSYNLQLSTDAKEKIIVGVGISQCSSDYEGLVVGVEQVARNTGEVPAEVVVDGGFTSRENILAMAQRGIEMFGSMADEEKKLNGNLDRMGIASEFRPIAFSYDESSNTYICPAGKSLKFERREKKIGRVNSQYRAAVEDCRACPFQKKCSPGEVVKGRKIVRSEEAPEVAAFIAKMETEQAKAIYKERAEVAEFPNAWLKSKIGLRRFRLRGLAKVEMEALWACLSYNIKQWIRLRWKLRIASCTAS